MIRLNLYYIGFMFKEKDKNIENILSIESEWVKYVGVKCYNLKNVMLIYSRKRRYEKV